MMVGSISPYVFVPRLEAWKERLVCLGLTPQRRKRQGAITEKETR